MPDACSLSPPQGTPTPERNGSTMTQDRAIQRARRLARSANADMYIVRDDRTNGPRFQVATAEDMDTFYAGIAPDFAVTPDGWIN